MNSISNFNTLEFLPVSGSGVGLSRGCHRAGTLSRTHPEPNGNPPEIQEILAKKRFSKLVCELVAEYLIRNKNGNKTSNNLSSEIKTELQRLSDDVGELKKLVLEQRPTKFENIFRMVPGVVMNEMVNECMQYLNEKGGGGDGN